MTGSVVIGIDVGGTFTDVVAVDCRAGAFHYFKLPSTRDNPARAALEGFQRVLEIACAPAPSVASFTHGTTVATNAILEGRHGTTALVTTAGFRDVLELARQRRPHLWNLDKPKPSPIALRDCRFEIDERLDASGGVVRPVTAGALAGLIDQLAATNAEAVAICLLHAYANPAHEEAIAAALRAAYPDMHLCLSSDVVGEFREYERFCSTVLNAALLPVMDRYLGALQDGVRDMGTPAEVAVMQSNGGTMSATAARQRPISTFLSGPAAGVVGAIAVGRAVGHGDFVTFDMGGTSTDVCLVERGTAPIRRDQTVAGMPVRTPTVDIHTVGAGGGSIAWIDAGGLLKVGPHSAGARPGPACYGHGGTEPTVSDANVRLGRLNPIGLLDGRLEMDAGAADRALDERIGTPLGLDTDSAAMGILEIVNASMVQAIRAVSVERGHDPRDFALMAFGGAGPLHAADIAAELGMGTVIIPTRPGLLCAQGLLHSDRRADFSRTRIIPLSASAMTDLIHLAEALDASLHIWREAERLPPDTVRTTYATDMRYLGQDFELVVPFDRTSLGSDDVIPALVDAFNTMHREQYGYASPGKEIEIVAMRVMAVASGPALPDAPRPAQGSDARVGERSVWFRQVGRVTTPVLMRERLPGGTVLAGPALLEQMDSTVVVPPGARISVTDTGDIVMDLRSGTEG